MLNLFFILSSVLCSSLAHLSLKLGADQLGGEHEAVRSILNLYGLVNGWLILGIFLHVGALGLWVVALTKVDISYAYPFIAVGYVLVLLLGWLLLGENVDGWKVAGTIFIIFGIALISQSRQIS